VADEQPQEPTRVPPWKTFDWRPAVYVLAGVALLVFIASLTGSGTGLFGWGFMMASMWLWVLLVIAALVLVGYFLGQRTQPPRSD
jgi:FtsH-binding integral membrane protein